MTTLFELTSELQTIAAQLEEITDADEITPEMGDQLAALLNDASDTHQEWCDKIDNTAALVRDREMWLSGIDREIARLTELKRTERNRIDWLKKNIMLAMAIRETDKLTTRRGKITISGNGGKAPIAIDPNIDPKTLPTQFQRVTIEPDTNAIREAIENGEPINFATIQPRGQHLRIR